MKSRYETRLTDGELWLLQQMRSGKRFPEIAALHGVKAVKVRGMARKIYNKLGADNRVQAVMFAIDMGLLDYGEFYGS